MKPLNPKDKKADEELAIRLETLKEGESGLLSRDFLPDNRELSEDEFAEQGLRNTIKRMLKVLQDPKTRDEGLSELRKAHPDISTKQITKVMQNELIEDDEKMKEKRDNKDDGGLIGGQKELDKNNDGDITGADFAIIRKEREGKQDGGMMMDDQMETMMQEETMPSMENQMADMMPPVTETTEEELREIEESQAPDEMMENNYIDFLIDEALDEDEEAMLMQELQANPQLSMLFDKVMEVAMEFSGSGPVEGPGTEVSDSIPARLSDGEFVFTAKAVEEIGADNLMSMMKEAEAKAEGRQMAQEGGLMGEEETVMPVQQEPVRQEIRVTKETVDSQAAMQDEEDLVGDEIKKSMLSGRPHVRS